ncbi:helix-turn-helix domain-containing protein [Paludibacterium yongneupense]|uniref:helix-turn-helix domain-containing protein n=1 Tax=Paludibacterium yongneupense TaxID=400061 RepID=UPI00146D36DD|nr:helix-turn-helix domain-containing protein [Paludibacterium yongneupense]
MEERAVEPWQESVDSPGGITLWRADSAVSLDFDAPGEKRWNIELAPGLAYLILTGPGRFRCLAGEVRLFPIARESLCCLLAFIDAPGVAAAAPSGVWPLRMLIPMPVSAAAGEKALRYCLIASALSCDEAILPLLTYLRQQESYSLVRFLDRRSNRGDSIAVLGQEYGLSYSHFRRLCRRALGMGVKAAFKRWRAARTLLRVADSGVSFTAAALDSGYCSSSQFSTEVRSLLGRSPRALLAPRF